MSTLLRNFFIQRLGTDIQSLFMCIQRLWMEIHNLLTKKFLKSVDFFLEG